MQARKKTKRPYQLRYESLARKLCGSRKAKISQISIQGHEDELRINMLYIRDNRPLTSKRKNSKLHLGYHDKLTRQLYAYLFPVS